MLQRVINSPSTTSRPIIMRRVFAATHRAPLDNYLSDRLPTEMGVSFERCIATMFYIQRLQTMDL